MVAACSPHTQACVLAKQMMQNICARGCLTVALPLLQDYFLSEVKVEPLMVVGFEGLFGVIAMALILAVVQFLPGQEGTGMLSG